MDNSTTALEEILRDNGEYIERTAQELNEKANRVGERTEASKKLTSEIKLSTRELAVLKRLVPEYDKNAKFNADEIYMNIQADIKRLNNMYSVERFDKYRDACYGILSTLRTGRLPDRSWLIGAPNGFGKTDFANECILVMEEKGMRATPYVSLTELAEAWVAEEQLYRNPIISRRTTDKETGEEYSITSANDVANYVKNPLAVTGSYSWQEYMNSECLFCHMTNVSSRGIESDILYKALSIRGRKRLPTVVMISTSLNPYLNDRTLKEYVWDEILGVEGIKVGYGRLTHVSCYKVKRNAIMNTEDGINNNWR